MLSEHSTTLCPNFPFCLLESALPSISYIMVIPLTGMRMEGWKMEGWQEGKKEGKEGGKGGRKGGRVRSHY